MGKCISTVFLFSYSTLPSSSLSSAIPYRDYIPVSNASANIAEGYNASSVNIVIVGDDTPELRKYFFVVLEGVELINSLSSSRPEIGALSRANVTIEDNDHVHGLFKVVVIGPRAELNRSRIVVNETEGLAVNLEVQRDGGKTTVKNDSWERFTSVAEKRSR